jgi:hypothetical protein
MLAPDLSFSHLVLPSRKAALGGDMRNFVYDCYAYYYFIYNNFNNDNYNKHYVFCIP